LATRTLGCFLFEEAPDVLDALACTEGFAINLSKYIESAVHRRLGPIEHAFARLREGRDRAQRLIELVSHTARHFRKGGRPGQFPVIA
jgi:hypothetical protein